MSDDPAVRAADRALDAAIQQSLHARGYDVGVVVDAFAVVALQHYDDDGDLVSSIARIVPGDQIPHYRMLGMLDVLVTRLRRDYQTDSDD